VPVDFDIRESDALVGVEQISFTRELDQHVGLLDRVAGLLLQLFLLAPSGRRFVSQVKHRSGADPVRW
jgi:hypothetical protein